MRIGFLLAGIVLLPLLASSAWAAPLPILDPSWNELPLRVDVRSLVNPDQAGHITEADMRSRVAAANALWSQCGIRFEARATENVSATELGVPFEPKSEDDLSRIASALNPHGFNHAIPLTFAGEWKHTYSPSTGLFLIGLGWVYADQARQVTRIGAMVDFQRAFIPRAGAIIAHELGHALSLPHTVEARNLMGAEGTDNLNRAQCAQARLFTTTVLTEFLAR